MRKTAHPQIPAVRYEVYVSADRKLWRVATAGPDRLLNERRAAGYRRKGLHVRTVAVRRRTLREYRPAAGSLPQARRQLARQAIPA